jgi:transcriptional regulator with XRE-family HTH domain
MTWDKDSVKNLRSSLKLTQNEFADLLGCRQQTVSEWEQGLYTPANAYGKLLTQLRAQSPSGFIISESLKPLEILPRELEEIPVFKAFDPAVD